MSRGNNGKSDSRGARISSCFGFGFAGFLSELRLAFCINDKMAPKRGGFLGSIIGKIGSFLKPVINTVTSLFGGAKEAAKKVGHNAIDRGAQALQQGLRTGDYRGAARQFAQGTRGDARGTYHQQYDRARDTMRRQVSERINTGHRQFAQHMRSNYNTYREHPRWQQQGMRRPPTYNSYYGAGFGKKHFKALEKNAHKHIGKIFTQAKKSHRAVHTKAGKAQTKAQRKRTMRVAIHAAHKEAKGGFLKFHRGMLEKLKKDIAKKGAGMSVGAGTKVGAGVSRSSAPFRPYKGAGTKVGAGGKKWDGIARPPVAVAPKRKKRKTKLGGMHMSSGGFGFETGRPTKSKRKAKVGAGCKKCDY